MAKKLSRPQILAIGTILDCARPFRKPVAFNILTGMYEIRSSTLDALERQDMIKRNPRHEYEVTESGIAEYRKAAPGRLETMDAYDAGKAAAPAQPVAAFDVNDKVLVAREGINPKSDEKFRAREIGTVLPSPDYKPGYIRVQFSDIVMVYLSPKELELWKPEPGSDAKDEYTRDEEQARLIARIRELEEAIEPFAALARAALSTLPDHAMPDSVWYQLNDVEITIAHFNAVIEALAEPVVE